MQPATNQAKLNVAYRLATVTDAELSNYTACVCPAGRLRGSEKTQRHILQTDFNGFVGYINYIDCD